MKNTVIQLSIILLISACTPSSKKTDNKDLNEQSSNVKENSVPFIIAQNYFIKNDVKEALPVKITTQKDFDKYFGMAAMMGENGKPTPIDFSKNYVIVVEKSLTNKKIQIEPIDLNKNNNELIFNYSVSEGADEGFSTHPFLMIIVDNTVTGDVKLKEN